MTAEHDTTAERRPPAGAATYLDLVVEVLARLREEALPAIRAAADLVAGSLARGRPVHVFGAGHSHLLAEEAYYRAGGLVDVRPLLFEGLMLHAGAPLSTSLERLPGLAEALLLDHRVEPGDVLVIASNSGANTVTVEMARLARERGVAVVAITSVRHATSALARRSSGPRLHELADVVIDNGAVPGDAAVSVPGVPHPMGPTSTVTGAAIVNAVAVETARLLVDRGVTPQVFVSANLAGGDDANETWVGKVRP